MESAQAVWTVILGVGGLTAIVTPLIKLNSSIVKLTSKIDVLFEDLKRNESRITKHGIELDELKEKMIIIVEKISTLEKLIEELRKGKC